MNYCKNVKHHPTYSEKEEFWNALVERALETELSTHLGYGKHELRPEGQSNSRNGYSQKKVQGDFGIAEIAVPRDLQGEFEPQMVKKRQSRLSGIDEKIIALYARGILLFTASLKCCVYKGFKNKLICNKCYLMTICNARIRIVAVCILTVTLE